MTNPVSEIFDNLTGEELYTLLDEIDYCKEHGHFPENGKIFDIARQLTPYISNGSLDMTTAEIMLYRQGAKRWKNLKRHYIKLKH